MEKGQLCKSTYNNQLQQSIYHRHTRNMSPIWQYGTMMHTYNFPTRSQPSTPYGMQQWPRQHI